VNPVKNKLSRRTFLSTVGLAGLGGVTYVRWVEPHWLDVGRHEIHFSKGAGKTTLKVLQLSDLHASPVVSLNFIKQAIRLGLKQQPDLILLTGDFITHKFDQLEGYVEALSPLAKSALTFACLGNHDGGLWAVRGGGYEDTEFVRSVLSKANVTLLHNAAQTVLVQDWNLTLIGLGDSWAQEMLPDKAFAQAPSSRGDATLLMSHNPDTKMALKAYAWDLMLCGHTHGGQVCLPLIGAPFAPVRDKKFLGGLYHWDNRWIHVTRGVGNLHGVRFNCRPEVSLLTLTRIDASP
jgi:predicted MPP superfamily phosphohydrolase